jgi:mRNA interferase MazF
VKRGELYRVYRGSKSDPKDYRVFVVVSRQIAIDSKFSTVTCAPVYSVHNGLSTQVEVGIEEGLKHESSIHCDELISIPKSLLTDFIGQLSQEKMDHLNYSLKIALELEN